MIPKIALKKEKYELTILNKQKNEENNKKEKINNKTYILENRNEIQIKYENNKKQEIKKEKKKIIYKL